MQHDAQEESFVGRGEIRNFASTLEALNILQVTNRIPYPLNDGGNIATYNVTRFLHHLGHRVTLASLNTRKHFQDPSVLKDVKVVHAVEIDTSLTPFGLVKGLFSKQPYNVERFRSEKFAWVLSEILRKEKFDIIQLEGSYLSIYIEVIRTHTKAPILLRSHNVEHIIWGRLAANTRNPFKRKYLDNLWKKIRKFELKWLNHYDGIIPIASQDETFYKEAGYTGRMRTINGGVDLAQFKPSRPPEFSQEICFLGSLEWQPNVQGLHWFLDKIWKPIHAEFPEATFHVAGKNPPTDLAKLQIPGMKFHGMVPDAAEFLDAHHIFVVPLLSGGGMRLKIVEAMANGKCILSTQVGAEGIACTHEKDILLADQPQEWIQVLRELLTSPEKSVRVANEGMKLAKERYSWESIVEEFVTFYKEVMQ